jgi:UDP:flavonoid glycosyltransferase YjiC (YdhE family)
MPRFLFAVWSFETHVDPFIAVASALRDQGDQVAFYAGPRAGSDANAQGFRVFPFTAVSEKLADAHVAGILADRRSPRKLGQRWYDFLISQLPAQYNDLVHIVREWHPDVIVSDMAMLAPFVAVQESKRVPVAVLSHVGYCMSPGPQGPVPGRAFPPDRTGMTAVRAKITRSLSAFVTRSVPRGIDAFRSSVGLKPTGLRVVDYYGRAPLFLIPTVPELDYDRRDLPRGAAYCGPCFWPPVEASPTAPGRRIIVNEGSLHTVEPTLLRAAVEAFRDSDRELVIIAGKHRDLATLELGQPGKNTRVLPWQAVTAELAGTSLLITTGNTESVLSAFLRGIPVLVAPSILDQSELAWRTKWFGAGDFIPEPQLTPARLQRMADRIMNQGEYAERARDASAALGRYRGPGQAADFLRQLARRKLANAG